MSKQHEPIDSDTSRYIWQPGDIEIDASAPSTVKPDDERSPVATAVVRMLARRARG